MTSKIEVDPAFISDPDAPACCCVGCDKPATHRSNYESVKGYYVWMCDTCDDFIDGDNVPVGGDSWRGRRLKYNE